jgi:hypothetical protein
MKRIITTLVCLTFILAVQAQAPPLPEILQEKLDQEQLDLTMTYDETENINSEEDYYVYINRDMGVDTLLGYHWNIELQEWELRARIIETYGDNELLMEKQFQVWTPEGTWLDGLYFQYTYNDLGNLTEMIIQHWRPDAGDWVNHFKKTQEYDDNGFLTDINTYWWHHWGEEWINHHHKIFTYNGDLLVADTVQVFHHILDEWNDLIYNEFSYNDAGLKILKTNYRKFMGMGDWLVNFRWSYTYDDAGENIIQVTGQDWHVPSEQWVDFNRFNYTYDDAGNVTYYLFERWNHLDSLWRGVVQIDYYYNDAGYLGQFVMQHKPMCMEDWTNKKQAFFTYDADGNMIEKILQLWRPDAEDWENFRKWEMLLDYKGGLTGIGDPVSSTGIRGIFRNPYQHGDPINFSGLEPGTYLVQVMDITGRTIETQNYIPGQAISLKSNNNNGLHMIILTDGDGILYQGKIILLD